MNTARLIRCLSNVHRLYPQFPFSAPFATKSRPLPHRLVLLVDEHGKAQGQRHLDTIQYNTALYDLTMVKDDPHLPVYRLQPRGLAYKRARLQHQHAVEARRASKIKQVRFRTGMATNDFKVHVDRVLGFVGEKEWRVRCVVEESTTPAKGGSPRMAPLQFAQRILEAVAHSAVMESPPEQMESKKAVTFSVKPKPGK